MRAFTFTEIIDRPPQRVWDVAVDPALAPRWRALVKSMTTDDGGPVRTGSRVLVVFDAYGKEAVRVSQIDVFEPPHRYTSHSVDQLTVSGELEFRFEPQARGTKVTFTLELRANTFLSWLFLSLIAMSERRRRAEMLGNLKRLVESSQ